jgi:hypothetical protein
VTALDLSAKEEGLSGLPASDDDGAATVVVRMGAGSKHKEDATAGAVM